LDWLEGALKESVIDHITLAVFAGDDPFAPVHMAKARVGGDGAGLLTLLSVHKKGSASTKCAHGKFDASTGSPAISVERLAHKWWIQKA
jgi:hypothetical protein